MRKAVVLPISSVMFHTMVPCPTVCSRPEMPSTYIGLLKLVIPNWKCALLFDIHAVACVSIPMENDSASKSRRFGDEDDEVDTKIIGLEILQICVARIGNFANPMLWIGNFANLRLWIRNIANLRCDEIPPLMITRDLPLVDWQ